MPKAILLVSKRLAAYSLALPFFYTVGKEDAGACMPQRNQDVFTSYIHMPPSSHARHTSNIPCVHKSARTHKNTAMYTHPI